MQQKKPLFQGFFWVSVSDSKIFFPQNQNVVSAFAKGYGRAN